MNRSHNNEHRLRSELSTAASQWMWPTLGAGMNRFSRYSVYTIISVFTVLLIITGQRLLMMPAVYSSIEHIGNRIGNVLPHGYSSSPYVTAHQPGSRVTLPKVSSVVPTVPPGVQPWELSPLQLRYSTLDLRAPITIVSVYLAALFFVSTVSLWKRGKDEFRTVSPKEFIGILSLGAGVSILLAMLYFGTRVFWTGVNESFMNRSVIPGSGESSTIHINGNNLLAMGNAERLMIMAAMILTALPILVWIDLKLFRRIEARHVAGDQSLESGGLSQFKLVERELSERSIKIFCVLSYVLVTLFLWTSPWSTTMVEAFLRS